MKHRIVFVGDLFPTEKNLPFFVEGDCLSLFGKDICDLLQTADLRFCNLEGALTDHEERCKKTGPVKVAPTQAVKAYKQLGIDCCLLANNHVTDGGTAGMVDTIKTLDEAGIDHLGAGVSNEDLSHLAYYSIGEKTVGLYNVSETMYNRATADSAGVWLYDEYLVCKELEEARRKSDYLIVIYHGGIEKFPYPSPEIRKRFHRMADSGADVVVAQHTHCVGCEEVYNGCYCLYGQGDFLLKNFAPGLTDSGLILEIEFQNDKVQVRKHLVHSVDDMFVRYSEPQDFTAFDDRSKKVSDESFVFNEFQKFCDNELKLYLTAFKNPSRWRLRQGRLFPSSYLKWLYDYSERNLLFTLHTLRSEQNRETAIIGIDHLLNKRWNHE